MFSASKQGSRQVLQRTAIQTRQFSQSIPALRGKPDHKRVTVQLLKDFPDLGVRGQLVNVTAGRMRNQLHRNNGAAYVLKGEPLRIPVVAEEVIAERQRLKAEARKAAEEAARAVQLEQEKANATGRLTAQNDMYNALENLTNLNFDLGGSSTTTPAAEATPAADTNASADSSDSSLFFLETAVKTLPALISHPASAQATGFLTKPVTAAEIAGKLRSLNDDVVLAPSAVSIRVLVDRGNWVDSEVVDFVGIYNLKIKLAEDRVVQKRLRVFPKEAIEGWEALRRPFGHPLPGSEAPAAAAAGPAAAAAEPAAAAKESTESTQPPTKSNKTFEWENEFIANLKK